MKKILTLCMFVVLSMVSGCANITTQALPTLESSTTVEVKKDEATVTFARNSIIGMVMPSNLFVINEEGEAKLISTINNSQNIRYITKAGKYTFVAQGESLFFMEGDLEEGKHYYVAVKPTMGLMSARFYLEQITSQEYESAKGKETYVSNPQTLLESEKTKIINSYNKWNETDASKKVKLNKNSVSDTFK